MKNYSINADSLKPFMKTIMVGCPHCGNSYVASIVGYDESTGEVFVHQDSTYCKQCKRDITVETSYADAIRKGI